jgi:ElaB/YqjD/DUF883 family membrane-anchored ribosome-binding protein
MKVAALRNALPKTSWDDGQESAVRLWNQARESGEDLLYQLHRNIRRHPWKAVAVALGAGLVLGALISRGTRD